MIDGVPRDPTRALFPERLAGVGVDVEAGEVAARDVEADPVPAAKEGMSDTVSM